MARPELRAAIPGLRGWLLGTERALWWPLGTARALCQIELVRGYAVPNMLRQVGLAIGVSVFIAVVGSPATPLAALGAWQRGWTVIALTGALAALVGAVALRRRPAPVDSDVAAGAPVIPESPMAAGITAALTSD